MNSLKWLIVSSGAVMLSAWLLAPATLAGDLPGYGDLKEALKEMVAEDNGGLGNNMWATVVDRDGVVCRVVSSGEDRGDQWPGSRLVSAEKANAANAFSLPDKALSSANLFSAVKSGGLLPGVQSSNPVNPDAAYMEPHDKAGKRSDPLVDKKIGGMNVFAGGLPLYSKKGKLVGAIGVSGDNPCAEHNVAWKIRHKLNLDNVPAGVSPTNDDNIVYDIVDGVSAGGFGHPECTPEATQIGRKLPETHPVGPGE